MTFLIRQKKGIQIFMREDFLSASVCLSFFSVFVPSVSSSLINSMKRDGVLRLEQSLSCKLSPSSSICVDDDEDNEDDDGCGGDGDAHLAALSSFVSN